MMRINDRASNLLTAVTFVAISCCFSGAEAAGTRPAARTRSVLVRPQVRIGRRVHAQPKEVQFSVERRAAEVEVVELPSRVLSDDFSPFVHAGPSDLDPSPAPCLECGQGGSSYGGSSQGGCGEGCCDHGGCDHGCDSCCQGCDWHPGLYWRWWENLSLNAGVHGFKGPADLGVHGNFGFHEGINWGFPIFPCLGVGGQLGAQAMHSNFSGSSTGLTHQEALAGRTFDDSGEDQGRDQVFFTAGVFHRVHCGWQWGVAFDFLHDEYFAEMDLQQVRGELSALWGSGCELGVFFAAGGDRDQQFLTQTAPPIIWEPFEQYALFYRHTFCDDSYLRVWAGATGDGDGLVGANCNIGLTSRFALAVDFAYLIPDENTLPGQALQLQGYGREAWSLNISLVWYPGGLFNGESCCRSSSSYRPLLDVANNSSFLVRRVSP